MLLQNLSALGLPLYILEKNKIEGNEINDIKQTLLHAYRSWIDTNWNEKDSGFLRFEHVVSDLDLLWSLNCALEKDLFYWSSKKEAIEVAVFGFSDQVTDQDFTYIENQLETLSKSRYWGGISFQDIPEKSKEWSFLGNSLFVLPFIELVKTDLGICMRCHVNCQKQSKEEVLDKFAKIIDGLPFGQSFSEDYLKPYLVRKDMPNQKNWNLLGVKILSEIKKKKIEKVVLSRKSTFSFLDKVKPFQFMHSLKRVDPKATHFCFQTKAGKSFLGGTPERLFKYLGKNLYTEALAGTVKRGCSVEADHSLARELVSSKKYNNEHELVKRFIQEELKKTGFCVKPLLEPRVLKLPLVQHLLVQVQATINATISVSLALKTLHPTPAVAGYPQPSALAWIKGNEPYSRGWYSGPVGWIGKGESEFVVAIRSGLVDGDTITLFSGAGFVEGSVPDMEWMEIDAKIGLFLKLFEPC